MDPFGTSSSPRGLLRSSVAGVCIAVLTTTGLTSCIDNSDPTGESAPSVPSVDATPGHIITNTTFDAVAPAEARRVVFRSTSATGGPATVSGTLLSTDTQWAGPGPRPLAVVTPGTLGMADRCASSIALRFKAMPTPPSQELLQLGWDVMIVDYEGLGTPGTHPYMNRLSAGHSTLDAARAALALRDSKDVRDDEEPGAKVPMAILGYSQGGGAAAAAAELAATYAPELDIKAVYAGAVPADLAATAQHIPSSTLAGAVGYSIAGLEATYPELSPAFDRILSAEGRAFVDSSTSNCVSETVNKWANDDTRSFTRDGRPLGMHLADSTIAARVRQQKLGGVAPTMPVFVTHNEHDDIVPVQPARDMVQRWTDAGADVTYSEISEDFGEGSHGLAFVKTRDEAFAWLLQKMDY